MRAISGKELCKILEKRGWVLLRIKGSHHIYSQHGNPVQLSIPVHGNKSLGPGLLRAILNQAGIDPKNV